MKRILFLLLFLPALCSAQGFRLSRALDSVAQLVVLGPDRRARATGTAFFVGDGTLVATAAHVYWGLGTAINGQRGGSILLQKFSNSGDKMFQVPVHLVGIDDEHDAAIFKADTGAIKSMWPDFQIKPLTLAQTEGETGENITFVGYFGNDQYPLGISGMLAGFTKVALASGAFVNELLLDRAPNEGQSGGPVFLARTGEVVGVVTASVPMIGPYPAGFTPPHSGVARATEVQYVVKLVLEASSAEPK